MNNVERGVMVMDATVKGVVELVEEAADAAGAGLRVVPNRFGGADFHRAGVRPVRVTYVDGQVNVFQFNNDVAWVLERSAVFTGMPASVVAVVAMSLLVIS